MDNKIIAILLVAIVVIAGVAAYALMSNGGNDDKKEDTPTSDPGKRIGEDMTKKLPSSSSRLWVFGNANEDDRIDSADVTYLQGVISGKNKTTVLCDTNADGKVDSADVDYLRSIIDAGKDTKLDVYYIDDYTTIQKVSWPVRTIAISYCSGVYTTEATGLMDKVAMVNDEIKNNNWLYLNSRFQTVPSSGSVSSPDWEAIIKAKIDVYVPGYFASEADKIAREQLQGIDVMFKHTCDGDGIANINIDRSILMYGYLLQGDMDQTYRYLAWHDDCLSKMKSAAATLTEKQNFVMTRNFIATGTSTYSITGGDNTNLYHATWAGVNCPTRTMDLTPNLYNSLTMEQIETVLMKSASPSNNTVYFIVNEHDGLRNSKDLDVGVPGWAEVLKNRPETIHYLGMAREGGNSPFYIVEMAFYQDVLYPGIDNGVDYREMMDYFIQNFTDQTENYNKYFKIENFFKDFGVL